MGDGSVQWLNENTDTVILTSLSTIAGGGVVTVP